MTAPARQIEATADQKILEHACDHLRRFGPKRTTILDIAEAAGMSHANVYRYFPSKLALFDAVTANWLAALEGQLRVIKEGPDPAYDKLERALSAIQKTYRAKLEADPALFQLLCDAIETNRVVARKHRNKIQGEIQAIVEEGISAGSFRMTDRRRAMALVFDLAHRFIQPISIALDRGIPAPDLAFRAGRAFAAIQRSLVYGDPDFDI
ncbi:AcrR family transcriptional regulator [Rhodoblastus acidophilus]|uniref:TetR/AcrR family transcriptional regulator n=1 Tax=Rhodoblastus acidophilus TaxID=1074 RepID=UPI0022240479|nr:TetR/AcrR family transcriptional regulator [Rhodoblastus acidophilus]MCW2285861.1 AcrR family transcriptional regulator [Rhodoblastus acidophilus]MCW2334755.1 AcrR family transcriptional regulator [Rhodoblastus acidophilus]